MTRTAVGSRRCDQGAGEHGGVVGVYRLGPVGFVAPRQFGTWDNEDVSVLNAFLSTWSSATIVRSVLQCCGSLTILTLLTGCHLFNDVEPGIDRSTS